MEEASETAGAKDGSEEGEGVTEESESDWAGDAGSATIIRGFVPDSLPSSSDSTSSSSTSSSLSMSSSLASASLPSIMSIDMLGVSTGTSWMSDSSRASRDDGEDIAKEEGGGGRAGGGGNECLEEEGREECRDIFNFGKRGGGKMRSALRIVRSVMTAQIKVKKIKIQ